jgi:tetratricopeptide (TPR) repeat protein
MGAGCSSQSQFSPSQSKNSFYSEKANRLGRVPPASGAPRIICLVFCIFMGSICLGSVCAIAQTAVAETGASETSRYTVSAGRLGIPAKAAKHLESAHQHFKKMDLSGALTEIDRSLQVDPNCARAFTMRSYLKLAQGDSNGAVKDATRAAALDPHDPESLIALATAYNSVKESQKAFEAAREALSIRPDSWQARLEMAKSLYGEDQDVLALSTLDLVNTDFPDVHLVRADVLTRLGRSQEAALQFGIFLQQAPNDPRGPQIRRIIAAADAGEVHPETR